LKKPKPLPLIPRFKGQGYASEDVERRRQWLEQRLEIKLGHVSKCSLDFEQMRGNIENPIGSVQMPLGIAGPLLIKGRHAQGSYFVPLATTEGALVRSYERGMVTITRAGGAEVFLTRDRNEITPLFHFNDMSAAHEFADRVPGWLQQIKQAAEATTSHGRLIEAQAQVVGRDVLLTLSYDTADAHGMNMIVKASQAVCEWLGQQASCEFHIFSGLSSEKRASGYLFHANKGKRVNAGVTVPAKILKRYLHVSPWQMQQLWQRTASSHVMNHAVGYNGHLANGLCAIYIACGQDVANVANSSVGLTRFEVSPNGDLFAGLVCPSLTLATVGGGVAHATSQECLNILGCVGAGKVKKLAEIVAASLLAGELSFGAAIASGEFTQAHEQYGRNRPEP